MKRTLAFIAALILLFMSSCATKTLRSITSSDYKEYADQVAQDLAYALENKDEETIQTMFSKSALQNERQLDLLAEYIENFEGEIMSVDGNYSGYGHQEGNAKTLDLDCYYDITTDSGIYELYFTVRVFDNASEDNIGIISVEVVSPAQALINGT